MRRRLLLCLFIVILTAGCGQKGPLYLPDTETEDTGDGD
jgi:predicted small lipoprotein YifL